MRRAMKEERPRPARPRVIVTRELADRVHDRLCDLFDAVPNRDDHVFDRAELAAAMADCDVLVPTVADRLDAALIEGAGERLRLIASFGAGVDHIDLGAAARRGIIVTNTPGVFTEDTADMTMALILSVTRRMAEGERLLRSGAWEGWKPSGMLGNRLAGKTLGIVGMGRIGQAVARRAAVFGLSVRYHNRRRLPDAVEHALGVAHAGSLRELLAASDIVTLHAPHTAETHEMIDAAAIAAMRPGAYLVNTARGELIVEEALMDALASGRVAGAGLDVFRGEPNVDPRWLALETVVPLPHMGSATWEGREASGERVIANIKSWADGHRPPDQVLESLTRGRDGAPTPR